MLDCVAVGAVEMNAGDERYVAGGPLIERLHNAQQQYMQSTRMDPAISPIVAIPAVVSTKDNVRSGVEAPVVDEPLLVTLTMCRRGAVTITCVPV